MRFALSDDQIAFRDAVRDLLAKEPRGERATWEALVEMGATSVLVPEVDGGLGLDEMTLVPILEQTGYTALCFPIVETAMVAAPAGIVGPMAALADGALVAWGGIADVLLIASEGELLAVDRADTEIEPCAAVDPSRPLVRLAQDEPGALVGAAALDRAALGTAAQLVGLGQAMLDMTVAYVKERHQFGVPIGSFQAVKHHLANALKELAFARPAVYRAAWSMADGSPTAPRDVSMAKALASDAAAFVGRQALQCHGAIGYTVEHDLHIFLKRTWALCRAYGDAPYHRDRVGRSIGV
jgi:alkylation response protein AidB-like acyl-CoA dehydrogenase